MYIEYKGEDMVGPARIGLVVFNKSGKSIYYRGRTFTRLGRKGFKANYHDAATGEHYWISGCKRDGTDALYSTIVQIDEEVREEYWTLIRHKPELKDLTVFKCEGKYSK
jgi:hypothetical protein